MNLCPSCLSDNHKCLGELRKERVLLCESCGLAFLPLKDRYDYDHSEWYDSLQICEDVGQKRLKNARPRSLRQLRILSSLVDGRDLLDIGAGIGTFAKVASENGWRVICTDINLKARDFGAQIYGLAYKNLEDIQSETMDVIRLSHVLEHILEPCPFLSEVRRTLKPGGVCQIIVPHYEPLNCLIKNLILRLIPGKHLFRGQLYAPQHVLGFTPFSLKNTLELAGFDTVRIHCVSRGNKTYYPWMSDDIKLSVKVIADELVNTVGNLCGRGSCIAGYFRK